MTPRTLGSAMLLTLSLTGCAGKGLRADLESALSNLDACQKSLGACEATLASQMSAADLADKRLAAYRDLAKRLRDALGMDDLDIILRNGRMVLQLPNKLLFDTGKAELKAEGAAILTKVASVLASADRDLLIAGHTDTTPVKADSTRFRNNWELSTLRATNAVKVLIDKGVPVSHLGAAGYGEFMPDKANDTEEGRAENRRLEVIIMPKLDELPPLPKDL